MACSCCCNLNGSSPIVPLRLRWQCPPERARDSQAGQVASHPTRPARRRRLARLVCRESSSDRQPTTGTSRLFSSAPPRRHKRLLLAARLVMHPYWFIDYCDVVPPCTQVIIPEKG